MTKYKVETKQSHTGGWESAIDIKPEYIMRVKRVWVWLVLRKEIGVISNLRQAELVAYNKAVSHAKTLYRHVPVRIAKITEADGRKTTDIVWQNNRKVARPVWWRRLLGLAA